MKKKDKFAPSEDRETMHHRVTDFTIFSGIRNNKRVIISLRFGGSDSNPEEKPNNKPTVKIAKWAKMIDRFLSGSVKDLSVLPIHLSNCPPFRQRVLLAARSIPWGKTISYAELARRAGNPGAARAAASAMRNNPLPLIIPCHRVIKSDGSLGGFMGKVAGKEVELKKRLLEREGVKFR